MKLNYQIENATKDDSKNAADLMHLAFGDLSFKLFGTKDSNKVRKYYSELWKDNNSRMSSRFAYVIRYDTKPIALLSCSEGNITNQLLLKSILAFLKIHPGIILYILSHLNFLLSLLITHEAEVDEFYIFVLAVFPQYQNNGLGTKLLMFAEEKAKSLKFKKLSLLVSQENVGAIKLYESFGFKKVLKLNKSPYKHFKMVKDLN